MLRVLLKPFQKFLHLQAASSALLLLATVVALIWANLPGGSDYEAFWQTPLSLSFGAFQISHSLQFWINEGLMSLFFLVVGLEIKRELLVGELSSPRQASLPILGALGGMAIPAAIYVLLNPPGSLYANGWAIPTVTDIAFTVGALTLLGNRVPIGLKVFLIALAIVDDIGAILVIALFYSHGLQPLFLGLAAATILVAVLINKAGENKPWPYLLLGGPLWLALLKSGIHPTIAGVLLAFTVPASAKIDPCAFHQQSLNVLYRLKQTGLQCQTTVMLTNADYQDNVQALDTLCEEVQAPLQRMEHALHPWVTYGILPLFALANAGVQLPWGHFSTALGQPLTLGIIAGLFLGKPIGITLAAWAAVRAGWAKLPEHVSWRQIHAAGILSGIGFTMSVFITLLAFQEPKQVSFAKLGILLASGLSAIVGVALLRLSLGNPLPTGVITNSEADLEVEIDPD